MVFDHKKQVFDLFRQTYWEKSCGFYFGSCQLPPEEKAEKAIHRQIWGKSCKLAGPIQQLNNNNIGIPHVYGLALKDKEMLSN